MAATPFAFGPVYDDLNSKAGVFAKPVIDVKTAAKLAIDRLYGALPAEPAGIRDLSYAENEAAVKAAARGFFVPPTLGSDPVVDGKIDEMSKAVAGKITAALQDLAATHAVPLDELVALLYAPERGYVAAALGEFRMRRTQRLVQLQTAEREMLDDVGATGARALPGSMVQRLAALFTKAEAEDANDLLALQRQYMADEESQLNAVLSTLASGSVTQASVGIFRLGVQAFVTQRELALDLRRAQYDYAVALMRRKTEVDTYTDKINTIVVGEVRKRISLDTQRKKLVDLTDFIAKPQIDTARAQVESANQLVSQLNNMVSLSVTTGLSQSLIPVGY